MHLVWRNVAGGGPVGAADGARPPVIVFDRFAAKGACARARSTLGPQALQPCNPATLRLNYDTELTGDNLQK